MARMLDQRATRLSFRTSHETLDDLARLPQDWDSYGAFPPTAAAISAVHGLLASLAEQYADTTDESVLPWVIAPLADGGVQIEWRGPGGAIEVEIAPDGQIGFLVERDEQTTNRSQKGGVRDDKVIRECRSVFAAKAVGRMHDVVGDDKLPLWTEESAF